MKLTEKNRALKLIALLIAIGLWLYVGTQEDPLSQRTYEVAVEMENLPLDKTATLGQETVKVRVMGRQDRLNALRGSDFKASVDLSKVEAGDNKVPVTLKLPSEVYFARIEPASIDVQVNQRSGKDMDVEIMTEGTLPEGVTLDEISVSPKTVFVAGDRSALADVARVGVHVDQSSLFDDSEKEVAVQFFDAGGNLIEDAELEAIPQSVTLTIKTSQSDIQKTVPVTANLIGQLPQGLQLESTSVAPETVTLSGSPETLADLNAVLTEAIDLSAVTESTQLVVALETEQTVMPETVTVTINVSQTQEETSGTMTLPLSIVGPGADMVNAAVSSVEVSYHMLAGYADAGNALTASIYVPEGLTEAQSFEVEISEVAGLVVDAVTPASVTVSPVTQ